MRGSFEPRDIFGDLIMSSRSFLPLRVMTTARSESKGTENIGGDSLARWDVSEINESHQALLFQGV